MPGLQTISTISVLLVCTAVVLRLPSVQQHMLTYIDSIGQSQVCLENSLDPNDLVGSDAEYDIIIVGGGTAGSMAAAHLATNSDLKVLLVEAGGCTRDGPSLQSVPLLAKDNLLSKQIDWNLDLDPQRVPLSDPSDLWSQPERRIPIPRGRVLGGSNELNFMLHVRGTPGDYDGWAERTGEARWGAGPMARLEGLYEGGIPGALRQPPHALAAAWVAAAGLTPHGNQSDYNLRDPAGDRLRAGAHHFQHAVRRGLRQSTARAFLLPVLDPASPAHRPNLHVLTHSHVRRVLLEPPSAAATAPSATGIEVEATVPGRGAVRFNVSATREVLLTAGAYHSPHLLMLSGVGPREELEAAGIAVRAELPGVGRHLQDHPIFSMKVRLGRKGGVWWPASVTPMTALGDPRSVWGYLRAGQGPLSTSAADFGLFSCSNSSYCGEGRPDLQLHGLVCTLNHADMQAFGAQPGFYEQVGEGSDFSAWGQAVWVGPTLLHARAEGSVRLRPGNPHAPPVIEYEAFAHEEDLRRLVRAVRIAQDVLRQPPLLQWEPEVLVHAELAAAFGHDTDEYWKNLAQRAGTLVYHPAGTCRMGKAGEAGAVVDPLLRVQGVRGLRVGDASIMPEITSGNTNVPTAAIALQAAQLVMADLLPDAATSAPR